jgi:hypothetical protein
MVVIIFGRVLFCYGTNHYTGTTDQRNYIIIIIKAIAIINMLNLITKQQYYIN